MESFIVVFGLIGIVALLMALLDFAPGGEAGRIFFGPFTWFPCFGYFWLCRPVAPSNDRPLPKSRPAYRRMMF